MAVGLDAVLAPSQFVSDDHVLVDLPLSGNLSGRYEGGLAFSRASEATFVDPGDGIVKFVGPGSPRFLFMGFYRHF